MKKLIKRLKSEKTVTAGEDADRYDREAEGRKHAYISGKGVAKIWINSASYQEIKDVLHYNDGHRDANRFAYMRNNYFKSIDKVCPKEAQKFQWTYNDSFMEGWQEGVNIIWDSIKGEVDEN
ncbi:MAG: hypothetical protein KQI81_16625 [Deltaproteobacteria bacterium]|nr:hypothetical protein [Deltaproteobacteria bacterium]